MAELFLAKDTRVNKVVVLKRILPYLAEQPEFVKMFLDEARIVSQLHHPNIVELHELGRLEGSLFITMEWVAGTDLRKLTIEANERSEPMPLPLAVHIVARLCSGLEYAHQRKGPTGQHLGIVHRDISPQNVMVSHAGEIKLVDFGIAKASMVATRSSPGIIKGKFLYLAPEQIEQGAVDQRTDLFAVGILLYELTCGRSPFVKTSSEAVIYAIRNEHPHPPRKVKPDYPPALEHVVLRLLEKDPAQRFQSARDVQKALEGFLVSHKARAGQRELKAYMDLLYGNENERTALNVPSTFSDRPTEETTKPTARHRLTAEQPSVRLDLDAEPTAAITRPDAPDAAQLGAGVAEPTLRPIEAVDPTFVRPSGQSDYSKPPVPTASLPTVEASPAPRKASLDDAKTKLAPTSRSRSSGRFGPVALEPADQDENSTASAVILRHNRKAIVALAAAVAVAMAALLLWVFWPSSQAPAVAEADPADGVDAGGADDDGAASSAKPQPMVRFEAPAGTVVRVGSLVMSPGETRPVAPGPLRVEWTCSAKRRTRQRTLTATFDISEIEQTQLVQLSCK